MVKRKKSKSFIGGIDKSIQKSLSTFIEDKDKIDKKIDKIDKIEKDDKKEEMMMQEGIVEIEKRPSNQIETDYYEQGRIDACAKRLREKFGINPEIIPVRYGSKLNQKIYGYYMLITVRDRYKEYIIKFIKEECNLKVYH